MKTSTSQSTSTSDHPSTSSNTFENAHVLEGVPEVPNGKEFGAAEDEEYDTEWCSHRQYAKLKQAFRNIGRRKAHKRRGVQNHSSESEDKEEWFVSQLVGAFPASKERQIIRYLSTMMTFLAAISVCDTHEQYATATLQMLNAVTILEGDELAKLFSRVINWFVPPEVLPDGSLNGAVENQAWYVDLRRSLEKVKEMKESVTTLPIFTQLSRCLIMASTLGLMPQTNEAPSSIVEKALFSWQEYAAESLKCETLYDMVLESVIFSLAFVENCVKGNLKYYISSHDLQRQAIEVLSKRVHFENGNLAMLDLTPELYLSTIIDVQTQLAMMSRLAPHGQMKLMWNRYLSDITVLRYNVELVTATLSPRPSPPTIVFTGDSQIGKSGLIYTTAHYLSKYAGFPGELRNFYYQNKFDAYNSGFKGDTTIIVEDDVGANNSTPQVDGALAAQDIAQSNIVPTFTLQADAQAKGKIPDNHRVKIKTSNMEDADIRAAFKYPAAAFNRHWFYKLVLKEEYADAEGRIDYTKLGINPKDGLPAHAHWLIPYKWECKVQKASRGDKMVSTWYPVYSDQKLDVPSYLDHLRHRWDRHVANGKAYVEQINVMGKASLCPKCKNFALKGYCRCATIKEEAADEAVENQFGLNIARDWIATPGGYMIGMFLSWLPDFQVLEHVAIRLLALCTHHMPPVGTFFTKWQTNIATDVLDIWQNAVFKMFLAGAYVLRFNVLLALWVILGVHFLCCILFGIHPSLHRRLLVFWCIITYTFLKRIKRVYTRCVVREFQQRASQPGVYSILLRMGITSFASISIVSLLVLARSLFAARNQGNIMPCKPKDIEERNEEINQWLVPKPFEYERVGPVSTMSLEQVIAKVSNSTVVCTAQTTKGTWVSSNAVMEGSNIMRMPAHSFEVLDLSKPMTIRRHVNDVGGLINGVYIANYVLVAPDFAVVTLSKALPFPDIKHLYAPEIFKGKTVATMISREVDGEITMRTLRYENQIVSNESATSDGSEHVCSQAVRKGLCASPIISHSKPHYIIGMHCGGYPSRPTVGVAFSVSHVEVDEAHQQLVREREAKEGYRGEPPINHCEAPLEAYGKQLVNVRREFDNRDVANFLVPVDEEHPYAVAVIGNDPQQRFKRFSEVQITSLSAYLEQFGRPRKWGMPKFNVNRNHSVALHSHLKCTHHVPPIELEWAVQDYVGTIKQHFAELEFTTTPLSDFEMVNGKADSRFVKRVDMTTSAGLGLASPKVKHFEIHDDPVTGKRTYTAKMEVLEEVRRLEAAALKGDINLALYKTALKDEPTKLDKDKVRVFQVAPLAYNLLIRKYFLPIMEKLFFIPLITEMWQGVNCITDEWDQAGKYISQFHDEHCLEGDFSAYDQTQDGQKLRAAGEVFRILGAALGYTLDEQKILEVLSCSIASKWVVWNGTILFLDGYTPSGVPITIFANGITNALWHRIAYRRLWLVNERTPVEPFRTYVRLGTVGDDSIAASRKDWFNMRNLQQTFASLNVRYTDGRKSVVAERWFKFDEIQLCKRKFRSDPRVDGAYLAPIELDSIYKSIHCYMATKSDPTEVLIGNVDNAILSLAFHTQEVFEREQAIIQRAAEAAGIDIYCKLLYATWDSFVPRLRLYYNLPVGEYISSVSDSESTGSATLAESSEDSC